MREQAIHSTPRPLALVALIGVAYFGLVILLLSLLATGVNPITQAASLYGIGPFAVAMNLGFVLGGVGILAFARALQLTGRSRPVGYLLLFVSGLVLIMDAFFTTDPEGAPTTLHGLIHGFGGLFFFTTAPVGLILVSTRLGRPRFLMTVAGVLIGFLGLVANGALSLNAGGLAERIMIFVIFSLVGFFAFGLSRSPTGRE